MDSKVSRNLVPFLKLGVGILALLLPALLVTHVIHQAKPTTARGVSMAARSSEANASAALVSAVKLSADDSRALRESVSRRPLAFEPNLGQTDGRVKFLSRGYGYSLFLTSSEAVLALRSAGRGTKEGTAVNNQHPATLRITLRSTKHEPRVVGVEEAPGKANYFVGNDPSRWRANVPTYRKVAYREVYPGIDLVYYGNQGQLECDFVLSPGADPKAIKLSFDGLSGAKHSLRIARDGDLIVKLEGGEVRFHKPIAYQWAHDRITREADSARGKQFVPAEYVLRSKREVAVRVSKYDPRKQLVIDPVLSYSSYLGGTAGDQGNAIAVDSSGAAYITGQTVSLDFPTEPSSALQTANAGGNDAFVAKFNPAASGAASLIYSTYLGGGADDSGNGIAVDSSNNVYVVGQTLSADFPTTANAYQSGLNGVSSAFLTRLDVTGSSLIYSTYLGGSLFDFASGVAVSGTVAYVTGQINSSDFPHTTNAFQTSPGGGNDAFVTKINTNLSGAPSLLYSTFLGGAGNDSGKGIAADSSGNAYVTGSTSSNNFPAASAFQGSIGGGSCGPIGPCPDAFVTKINTTMSGATSLVYSTYLGGNGIDSGSAIALGSSGVVYVTGQTRSANFPTKAGALRTTSGGGQDAFVSKVDTTKSSAASVVYSTYLGGNGSDSGNGIAVDAGGNAYVAGSTTSTNFPSAAATQSAFGGVEDAFVSKLNSSGSALIFSSYLGGSGTDLANGIAVDSTGAVDVVGTTASANFPKVNPFQAAIAGSTDAFLAKLSSLVLPVVLRSPASLTFSSRNVGISSAPSAVTVRNAGDGPLTVSSVTIAGTNGGDFSETQNCVSSSPIAPAGGPCAIDVVFTPSAGGSRSATMTITDSAPDSPQRVTLTGTGTDFSVAVSPSSASVAPGSPATYTITVAPIGGFNQTVTLACSGAPQASVCGINPSSLTPSGSGTTAQLTILTLAHVNAPPRPSPPGGFLPSLGPLESPWSWGLLALATMMLITMAGRRRRVWLLFAAVVLFVSLWAACGGGGALNPVPVGTPSGNYTITVRGTSGNLTHSASVSLTVF